MALTKFTKTCTSFSGGIKTLYLIPKGDITSFTKSTDGSYSAITLPTGKGFSEFQADSHKIEWKPEGEVGDNGVYVEKNTIEAYFSILSQALRDSVQSLIDQSPCGLVAIVEEYNDSTLTSTNRMWVVGYNEEDGFGEPLKMKSDAGSSGKAKTDDNGVSVTLYCEMGEKAREYTVGSVTTI